MAYNNQQNPFWDFVQGFNYNRGAGVDQPADNSEPFFGEGHGSHPHPPHHGPGPHPSFGGPFGGPFAGPFGGPFSGPFDGHRHGGGGRGRRGRFTRRNDSHERATSGDVHDDPSEVAPGDSPAHTHGPHSHGPHPFGHHGRYGRRGGRGGPGHRRPQVPLAGDNNFDLSGMLESLGLYPLVQAFRTYTEQAGQQSGEVAADDENNFTPPIDVFSTPAAYILHVALPGAKKEDVGVNWDAEKGVLNLAGVVYRQGDEEFLKTLSQSERKVGAFERAVKLPPGNEEKEEVDGDRIHAKLEDGVLVVTVPKVEKEWTEVKRVDIE